MQPRTARAVHRTENHAMERERSATIPQQLAPSTSDEQVRAHFERAPACLRRIAEEERQLQREAARRAPSERPRQYD